MSLTVADHPVIHDRLACLRHRDTGVEAFRRCLHQITALLVCEATRLLPVRETETPTPLVMARARVLARPVVVVPILRAGLGMVQGVLSLLPEARIGHIGLARNEETKLPESYYSRFPPELGEADVILVDPMLATGRSAAAAVTQLKAAGARNVMFLCIIAAPEGVAHFHGVHPEVPVFTGALDDGLTAAAFITPGLGDAGDRYCGTL
jgi:uracil phosphoribosyltransferase